MNINNNIFRAYDIRGIAYKELTEDLVFTLGKSIGTSVLELGETSLIIGRDGRNSSPDLKKWLSEGVMSTGCDVINIGVVPTPLLYFSTHKLQSSSGVMITGSHNPAEFNGFKISSGLHSLYGEKIKRLKWIIDTGKFAQGVGKKISQNILNAYMDKVCQVIQLPRPVKVVVDGGNGCFGIAGINLLKRLGLDPVELYCEPDGSFPNHHPDPTVAKYLTDLIATVKSEKADSWLDELRGRIGK